VPTTTPEGSWREQLASFDTDLRVRGMAEKTRRAYGTDLDQLAEWATAQGLGPLEVDARMLRRFAGVLSERARSTATS
jgi:integrase/recombinase XerC/integrase/recombinase XerD